MMFRKLLLIGLLFCVYNTYGQTISSGYRNDCVGGNNLYYLSGGTAVTWAVTGSYTNLVVSGNSVSFTWSGPYTGAKISVSYTGVAGCSPICTSQTAAFNVTNSVTPSVTITPATVSNVFGTLVTLTANPTNSGSSPTYSWYLNDVLQTIPISNYYSSTLQNGDQVYVKLNSNAACPSINAVKSTNTVVPVISYLVTSPSVSSPTIPYNSSTTLTASGAGSNEVYRWWDIKSGGSYLVQGTSYTTPVLLENKTYYVSKYNTSTLKESARVPQVVTLVIPSPSHPTISTNTCGGKTLTRGTPPANTVWYWQGTDPNGTLTNSNTTYEVTEATSQTYYLRARTSAGNVWSVATGINVTTDPVDIEVTSYQPQNATIQATSSITLKPGVSIATGNQFTARIIITWECNDIYNWSEQIIYDQNETPLARSRVYLSGLGQELQNQTIDAATGKVWISQPIYDRNNIASAATLAAPVSENDFIFKKKFVTNTAGLPYADADFNLPINNNTAGEIKNPKPVGNSPNTLGWYYSTNNTMEPNTPVTSFPYSRSYTPEGPDPTTSTEAAPGDHYRMGSNHEVVTERFKFNKAELSHYFSLRPYFVTTPLPVSQQGSNLISNPEASSLTGYTANLNVTLSAITLGSGNYVKAVTNQNTGTPGVFPIGGTIAVTAGSTYTYRVKGYRSSAFPVSLYVQNGNTNASIPILQTVLPGGSINEDWVEASFIIPTGCSSLKVGVLWGITPPPIGDSFYINAVSLTQITNSEGMTYGYKFVSTDPDGKKNVSFVDLDGNTLASAVITTTNNSTNPPTYQYDYWSYNYYNDLGQLVAMVAPNGVTGSSSNPQFTTTFKYDHFGRLIETTSPDEGTSRFVYSLDGKLRFSENQEQRNATYKKFSYTNYDKFGRPIETGEYTASGTNPFEFQPHTVSVPSTYSILKSNTLEAIGFTGVSRKLDAVRCTDHTFVEYDIQGSEFLVDLPNTTPFNIQTNTFGQVTKTENANSKTWYSYDEFGQLSWTKQKINDVGVKTIAYEYDYFGNVTQVAYQNRAGETDKFFHHYEYDINQRMSEVYTSLNGSTKTLRARYMYYLHGPLKRIELMNGSVPIQGLDYVYTINGQLKSINNAEIARDPGNDGFSGDNANFPKDIFGLTLHYHDNDYLATYDVGGQTINGYLNQYGGLIKAQSWHNATDNNQGTLTYAYGYDNVDQMSEARFGNVLLGTPSTFSASDEKFREAVTSYDKNGNIMGLIRKGKTENILGNYTYLYEANTNKLDKVNNSGSLLTDYTYNAIGQMTQQAEDGNTMNVTYNAYGIAKEVRNEENQLMVSYHYDDRGDLVKKITPLSPGEGQGGEVITFYIRDASGNPLAIYEGSTLVEVPVYGSGRVALYKPQVNTYFYELGDHLGNVRAVIGNPEQEVYTATFENNTQSNEQSTFQNYTRSDFNLFDHTDAGSTYTHAQLLTGGHNNQIGLAKSFKVSPGDVITTEVFAKYRNLSATPTNLTGFAAALTGAFGLTSSMTGELGLAYTALENYGSLIVGGFNHDEDEHSPKAFLNILLFDANHDFVDAAWVQLSNSAEQVGTIPVVAHEQLYRQITVTEAGYAYIFLSNENPTLVDVYFDDISITHEHSPVVAGADYYPFGLVMDGREITDEYYRYGYQGQYSEKNDSTGWNEFYLRMYDPKIGRWLSPDSYRQFWSSYVGMGNIPHMGIDIDGGWADIPGRIAAKTAGRAAATAAGMAAARAIPSLPTILLKEVVVTATRLSSTAIIGNALYNGTRVAAFSLSLDEAFKRGNYATYPKEIRPVNRNPVKGETRFDCSGWVSYCLGEFYPELGKQFEASSSWIMDNVINKNGGVRMDNPMVGDIAVWEGHFEFVVQVHGNAWVSHGSSGKNNSAQPTKKSFSSPTDSKLKYWGTGAPNGKFLGFYTPVLPTLTPR